MPEGRNAHLHQRIQARDHALADKELHRAARKVLVSLQNHGSGLTVFVDHPEIRDNIQTHADIGMSLDLTREYFPKTDFGVMFFGDGV